MKRELLDTITYTAQNDRTITIKLWRERNKLYNVVVSSNGQARGRTFHTLVEANNYITTVQS